MTFNQTNNIYPKSVGMDGCRLQIYWNTSENTWEYLVRRNIFVLIE
jgi:hypothetical protein